MIIYKNNSTNPYYNLASEQYLLDNCTDSIFVLWRNDSAVVIGKNQNAFAELDLNYVEKNSIKVVRRLTGGGAVFHDVGNINFSYIVPAEENSALDFARFTTPVINALKSLGIENVALSGRNDILIDNKKISGNAQCQYNGKTLHHGTLLFSSDLSKLAGALRVDEEKIKSKGIKSVRGRVGNIKDYLKNDMSVVEFMEYLENYIARETGADIIEFSDSDKEKIQRLSDTKYSTWEWNFGKSKDFSIEKKKRFDFGSVCINMSAKLGIIENIKIYGDFFGTDDVDFLENMLMGTKLEKSELENKLKNIDIGKYIAGLELSELIELML